MKLKWFKRRNKSENVHGISMQPPISTGEPFWRGDDGVAMEQCSATIKIAAQKVDPR